MVAGSGDGGDGDSVVMVIVVMVILVVILMILVMAAVIDNGGGDGSTADVNGYGDAYPIQANIRPGTISKRDTNKQQSEKQILLHNTTTTNNKQQITTCYHLPAVAPSLRHTRTTGPRPRTQFLLGITEKIVIKRFYGG